MHPLVLTLLPTSPPIMTLLGIRSTALGISPLEISQLVKGVMEVTLSQLQGIALEVLEVLEVPEVPSTFPEG